MKAKANSVLPTHESNAAPEAGRNFNSDKIEKLSRRGSELQADALLGGVYYLRFTRRRYQAGRGIKWFCWVHFLYQGNWWVVGDPWDKYTPAGKEIRIAIAGRSKMIDRHLATSPHERF